MWWKYMGEKILHECMFTSVILPSLIWHWVMCDTLQMRRPHRNKHMNRYFTKMVYYPALMIWFTVVLAHQMPIFIWCQHLLIDTINVIPGSINQSFALFTGLRTRLVWNQSFTIPRFYPSSIFVTILDQDTYQHPLCSSCVQNCWKN